MIDHPERIPTEILDYSYLNSGPVKYIREDVVMAERNKIIEECEGIRSALESGLPEQDLSEREHGYEQGIEDYFQAIRALKEEG
jgi:hypothetical protein